MYCEDSDDYDDSGLVDNWNWMDDMHYNNDPCGFVLRNDHGGRGWCARNASADKCILDEAIATLLVTWGYDVPTTRKSAAFFLMVMNDAATDFPDLSFKERVELVYKNFDFSHDDVCGDCWWDPDDWDEWLLVQDVLLSSLASAVQEDQPSSFALSPVPASPVPLPVPLPAPVPVPLASAAPFAAASSAAAAVAAVSPPVPAPPAAVCACAAAAVASAAAAPAGAAASASPSGFPSSGFPAASSLAAASAPAAAPSSAPFSARAAASASVSASALASAPASAPASSPRSPLSPPPFLLFGPLVGAEHTAFVGVVRPLWVGWTPAPPLPLPSFVPFPSSPFFPWFGWDPGWILPSPFLLPSVRLLRAFLAGVDFSNPLLSLVDGVSSLQQTRDTEDCARTTLIVPFVKCVGGLAPLPLLLAPDSIRSRPHFSPTRYIGVASRNGPPFGRVLLGALASPSCSVESYGGESCGSGAVCPRIGAEPSTGWRFALRA